METYLYVSTQDAPSWNGTREVESEADAATCPDCHAGPGELCRNLVSGYGHPPIPHPKRTKLAQRLRQGISVDPPVLGS